MEHSGIFIERLLNDAVHADDASSPDPDNVAKVNRSNMGAKTFLRYRLDYSKRSTSRLPIMITPLSLSSLPILVNPYLGRFYQRGHYHFHLQCLTWALAHLLSSRYKDSIESMMRYRLWPC